MRENDLFEIIGDIDNEKIEEAYNVKPKNKNFTFVKRLSFAACFILIAAISFSVVNEKRPQKDSVTTKHEKGGEVIRETPPKEEKTEINNDTEALADTERKEIINDVMNPSSAPNEDGIVTDDVIVEESSDYTSGGGGGGSGGSASLREEFSFDYLISLNEEIILQTENGEFPFVISSFVNEDTNKVEVLITSMDEEFIGRIKALDTKGGAIEFKLN